MILTEVYLRYCRYLRERLSRSSEHNRRLAYELRECQRANQNAAWLSMEHWKAELTASRKAAQAEAEARERAERALAEAQEWRRVHEDETDKLMLADQSYERRADKLKLTHELPEHGSIEAGPLSWGGGACRTD